MQAVILAGGLGTRLLPLTETVPKPLVPCGGAPFVEHQVALLARAGARRVVVATGYRSDAFDAVLGRLERHGATVVLAPEPVPLGTGGGLDEASRSLLDDEDDVVVVNGDTLWDGDLAALVRRRRRAGADVCMLTRAVGESVAYGTVTESNGQVTALSEKASSGPGRVNGGYYATVASFLRAMRAPRPSSLERDVIPAWLAAGRRVVAYHDGGYWADVGTLSGLVQTSADLIRGAATSPLRPVPLAYLVEPDACVSASATVRDGSYVGHRATVDGGATVARSIVADEAHVEAGALVERSVVAAGATVARGSRLVDGVAALPSPAAGA